MGTSSNGLNLHGRREYCHPHTDSKQPKRQGQRGKRGILWIRASGIPLIGKCSFFDLRLGKLNEFCCSFPQPEWPHPMGFPDSRIPERVARFFRRIEKRRRGAPCPWHLGTWESTNLNLILAGGTAVRTLDRSGYVLATKGVLRGTRATADACR